MVSRPSVLDHDVAAEIVACAQSTDKFDIVMGKTMCTVDFYEGAVQCSTVQYSTVQYSTVVVVWGSKR